MAGDAVIDLIAKQVAEMNKRGLENAATQATIAEKVANIENIWIKDIKPSLHTSVNCPIAFIAKENGKDILKLEDKAKKLENQISKIGKSRLGKRDYGYLSAIILAIGGAIAGIIKLFVKP